ncbi:hypothetical protein GCM10007901_14580 [Dyella acidisoli]|uniref:diguanylate cyclase n=2 Tax=Dyella acidisoli TaxID=1867834 RepID=A0ABQ5XND1_9GAMM|nr:hypothetical protein GCM10007901_14580 [Dyella acidisoli]
MADTPRPPKNHLPWLLLAALAGSLLAWWATARKSRQLSLETERLSRRERFLHSAHQQLQQKSKTLQQLSMHDPLTGVLNRHAFAAELRERLDHLARYNQPLNLLLLDLDHFKAINDRYGHLVGDTALCRIAGVVREQLTSDDLLGRFGGDEFMIACAGRSLDECVTLANAIRTGLAKQSSTAEPATPTLTLSIGIAQANAQTSYQPEELFARADTALYAVKQRGRDGVAVADEDLPPMPATNTLRRHL